MYILICGSILWFKLEHMAVHTEQDICLFVSMESEYFKNVPSVFSLSFSKVLFGTKFMTLEVALQKQFKYKNKSITQNIAIIMH